MISRVAESCFWLTRYMERLENTSRILTINQSLFSETGIPTQNKWLPVLVIVGEKERFIEIYGLKALQSEGVIQDYLTWNDSCPVSLYNTVIRSWENARQLRDILSVETWESIHNLKVWLTKGESKEVYRQCRYEFYHHIIESCQLFQGTCHNTIRHDEPFDFMCLGTYLERAGQTARILNLDMQADTNREGLTTEIKEGMGWLMILECCSAREAFYKSGYYSYNATGTTTFLLQDLYFPRSVYFCLNEALREMERIKQHLNPSIGNSSVESLKDALNVLSTIVVNKDSEDHVKEKVIMMIEKIDVICEAIKSDFFTYDMKVGGNV